jgi:uncharacterized protein (DUF433 family)
MAITKNKGRQDILSAYVDINFADVVAAGAYNAIDLPVGAQVVGGDMVVDTVFNSTTNTLSVGDASSAARYLGATDTKTAARTALVPTGFRTTATQPSITVTAALTGGAPTTGQVRLRVDYIVNKRAAFAQG